MSNFTFLGETGLAAVIVIVAVAAIFAFEILMFISAIRNSNITTTARVLWLIGMLLIHPFVAIVYFFTDYKKENR